MREVEAAIEGILFASGEPVKVERICVAMDLDRPTVEQVLQKLMDYYAYERRGVRLVRMEDCWQMCSAPDYADVIRKAFEIRKPARLSQPALEVLTIIAYYQPTTRAYVDQIRGVDSAYTIGLLLERKLIEECGRLQVPGRPHLYRTTRNFLRAFRLTSLDDLPEMPDLGGEGQMLMGALGMTLMGVPPIGDKLGMWSLPTGILLGIVLGAAWSAAAGFFRVKFHASEIVVTLMLNYTAEQFISYMVFYPLRSGAEPQSAKIAAALPKLYQGSRINLGVVIALALTVVYAVVIRRTRFGYHLRALGGSQRAAAYSGVNKNRYYFLAMLISGAFCGLAGAVQISGNTRRLMEGVAGDFGFSGIVVAMLGSLHPAGMVIAALFMALLEAGSMTMQVRTPRCTRSIFPAP